MRVDDFQLIDDSGIAHRLYYYKSAPAIVLMTQGNGCPIVRNAMPGYRAVRDAYADKGIRFFLLNSNLQDNSASIAAESADYGFDIPILVDEHQLIGESLKVTRTAEIFVIDPGSKKVVYHGPVDDRVTYQTQRAQAKYSYLTDALDSVLAGEDIAVTNVDAPGCIVNFPERERRADHLKISYHDTIAPLLEKRCVGCHQVGGIGPWAMSNYQMVKGFAPMIREVIRTDRMPPWNSDPGIGHFLKDKSLLPDEIKTLVHWVEAGAPRGEGPDPLDIARTPPADWPLGEPDLIIDVPAFEIPATGIVDYQYPVVANPLTEPKWLKAATVNVGSKQGVHHVLTGTLKEMPADGKASETRWGASVGGYAVGAESQEMRDKMGSYLEVGGATGMQMHYTSFGKAETDNSRLGLYFYDDDKMPELIQRSSVILDVSIKIPANAARHKESAYVEFPQDAVLYYAFPHAHYRGHASTLAVRYPDGREEIVLSLPKYDFNWQRQYEFEEPIEIPAGSKLIARYIYDNSDQNPYNPDHQVEVLWGEQSHEEMLFTAFGFRWKDETVANPKDEYQAQLRAGRGFGMLDNNIDGVLEKDELVGRVGERIARGFVLMDRDQDGALSMAEFRAAMTALAARSSTGG
ncbi:MAG: redoxin domain-containing protein [Halieaceae bacterium]|nr:redoxin domain-containing protein [Halieaceae bacterium]